MTLIQQSHYYGVQVLFFFAMLVSPHDVISCEVINVKNFREILRFFFEVLATPLHIIISSIFEKHSRTYIGL